MELEQHYHFLIPLDLNKRKKELVISDYLWVKLKAEEDVNEFYRHSEEEDFGFWHHLIGGDCKVKP